MPFTAVVITWNSADEVAGLIESVQRHLGDQCELLFIDNGSEDNTVEIITQSSANARVIALDSNIGFGPANNLGVEAAETDVVVLLNPDTRLVDDSLAELCALAACQRGLFAPRLLNEDSSPQISARPGVATWESALISIWPGHLMPAPLRRRCEPWRFEETLPAGWISGACIVAQRQLLLVLGPFDELLILYGEDADLCLRGWQRGIPSVSAADVARVVHLGNRSGSQVFGDQGMERKIEARWWVVHTRLGRARGISDIVAEFALYGSRWLAKLALRRDARIESTWLRSAVRVVRAGAPRPPRPLPKATSPAGLPSCGPYSER